MSNSIVFSIIIPVYNAGKWIAQTIASMQEQTEKNIEIICIDDCSTDNSAGIIEKIALTDPRVHLIRNYSNSGPGKSRNIGLRLAKGEFIHFFDADDYLCDQNFYKEACQLMVDHCLDVMIFNNFEFDEKSGEIVKQNKKNSFVYSNTELEHVLDSKELEERKFYLSPFPSSKLYRKSFLLFNEIFFPEGIYWEDTAQTVEVSLLAKRIWITDKNYWVYRTNVQTQTSSNFDRHVGDIVPMHGLILSMLQRRKLYQQYKYRFLIVCYDSMLGFFLPRIVNNNLALRFYAQVKDFFLHLDVTKDDVKKIKQINSDSAEAIAKLIDLDTSDSDSSIVKYVLKKLRVLQSPPHNSIK